MKNWHVLINCIHFNQYWTGNVSATSGPILKICSVLCSVSTCLQWKLIPTFRTTSLTWRLTAVGTIELSTVDAYLYIEQKSDAYSQYLLPIFIKCSSSWVSRSGQTWRWWALEDSKQHNLMLMHLLFSVKLYSVYIVLFYFIFFVKTIFSETSTENRETLFVFKLTILSKNKKYLLFYL